MNDGTKVFKSGFVAVVGRPNVGKSTRLMPLGHKVAIVSDKPQTTRNTIRGVLTLEDAQIIFLDTPGCTNPCISWANTWSRAHSKRWTMLIWCSG